jgi:hypothetical protein
MTHLRRRLKTVVLGERQTIAGTVYGTIIVLAVLAAAGSAYKNHLWQLDAIVCISALVLWIAHIYSHGLGESLALERRLGVDELRSIARREYSIILAAILPTIAVTLGAIGVLKPHVAVRSAFVVGIITISAQGIRYARLEDLSRFGTIVTVSANLALALAIVAMEAWVAH